MVNVNVVDSLAITVNTGIINLQMTEGDTRNLAYFIQVVNETGATVQTQVFETVTPSTGLNVVSDNPGVFNVPATVTRNINQVLTATTAGDYQIEVTGTILGGGPTDSVVVNVSVLPPGLQAELLPLGAFPSGISIGTPTEVIFTVSLVGSTGVVASSMTLERLDATGTSVVDVLGALVDDGTQGDIAAGDSVYSTTVQLNENSAGTLKFRATADVPGVGTVVSPIFTLEVTPFPVGIAPSEAGRIAINPETEEEVVSNELLVTFVDGTTAAEILSIVGTINGSIVGTIPGAGLFQVRFPTSDTFDELVSAGSILVFHPS
ncbi:MAG: choice-of-anchor X domain-containing protein [Candidatus Competibacteraceae bacterium]